MMSDDNNQLKLEPNVPAQIALKFPEGRLVDSRFGQSVMFTLVDGRVLFLDSDVATSVNMLGVQPGERFFICKRWNGERKQPARWDVWLSPDAEKARAVEEAPELERQVRASLDK